MNNFEWRLPNIQIILINGNIKKKKKKKEHGISKCKFQPPVVYAM